MQAARIEIKKEHGQVVVLAIGRTGRGQSYIKSKMVLGSQSISDKNFKTEMGLAVSELLGSGS